MRLLLIVLPALLSAACGDAPVPTWEYLADNPLDRAIAIKIDDREYVIPASGTLPIEVAQGRHTLTYNGSSAKFVTKVNGEKTATILNPTLSNYVLHGYSLAGKEAKRADTAEWPAEVIHSLFIDRAHSYWSFGLDEDADLASRCGGPSQHVVYKKLFRAADYRKAFAGELPATLVFPENNGTLSNQPAYAFPVEWLLGDCEETNEALKELGRKCDDAIARSDHLARDVEQLAHVALARAYPGSDETFEKLSQVMKYMTDASTFIVK